MNELFSKEQSVPNQFVKEVDGVLVSIKREDLLHPIVSGNKFRKLKYNLEEAISSGKKTVLTFGGAFSNHIAATAQAAKISGLQAVGVIRGEELAADFEKTLQQNDTLKFATSCGMKLVFVSRKQYKRKDSEAFLEEFRQMYGDFYLLPEGGTNASAVKGCEEILTEKDKEFDIICCPVGTGGTVSGLINASSENQQILGFSALKGNFLRSEISKFSKKNNWELIIDYHFGGYAKVNRKLVEFINDFKSETGIQLDPVYTGKMMFGIFDLIKKGKFSKNTCILAIHTGGLQGVSGINRFLETKKLPKINL